MPILADHVPIDSRDWLLSHGVRIAVILVAAFLVMLLARVAVRRMHRRLEGAESVTQELDLQRATTLTQALYSVIRVVVWTLAGLLVLGQFDINLGPLLAGAGIAGVALGFGAQTLVKDFLSGFFILLEDQYGVGDVIQATTPGGPVAGKVEVISLRVTRLRDFDGTLHYIPNGNIMLVGNKFKGWARVIVDVGVAYGEEIDRVRAVLDGLFEEIRSDDELGPVFLSGPEVLGVERFTDYEIVVRIVGEVRPSKRWEVERELRKRIKQRFDREGVEIPFPHQVLVRKDGEPEPEAP